MQSQFNQKLIDQLPTFLSLDKNENVEQFLCGVRTMEHFYQLKKENEVRKCFERFDLDGNGYIDKQELAGLSLQLGHKLDEQQLNDALKDLDLNHDGTVDFDEFCRWYFTGMKPYTGAKRSMLQVGMKTTSVFEALKKESISNIIKKDQSLTKHRMSVKFNTSPEGAAGDASWGLGTNQRKPQAVEENHVKVKGHVFGPQTAKIGKWFDAYKAELLEPYKLEDDQIEIYFNWKLKVLRRNDQVEKAMSNILMLMQFQYSHKLDMSYKYERDAGLVTVQGILRERKKVFGLGDLEVPDSLQEVL